jgi:hypothetical protein
MSPNPYLRLYIIVRNDLQSLNPGKAMAQAAHASNQLVHEFGDREEVKEWQAQSRGFGTTIVLAANGLEIKNTINKSKGLIFSAFKIPVGLVYDDTYPYITTKEIQRLIPKRVHTAPAMERTNGEVILFRKELTCGYLLMNSSTEAQLQLVRDFSLHP